jgi:hypothetical protein
MFPGFPHFWSRAARIPITPPTQTIPHLVAKKFFIPHLPLLLLRLPVAKLLHFAICIRSSWALAQKKTGNPMIFSNTNRYYIL